LILVYFVKKKKNKKNVPSPNYNVGSIIYEKRHYQQYLSYIVALSFIV
jgi:hypothetical protein